MDAKSTSDAFSALASQLGGISMKLFKESDPTRLALFSQIGEALKTGGIGAQIPLIQTAVAGARSGLSKGLEAVKGQLARLNLGSDPLSQALLAQGVMGGEQTIAGIAPDMAAKLGYGMGPNMSMTTTGQAISGLGTAAGINRTVSSTTTPNFFNEFFTALLNAPSGGGVTPGSGGGQQPVIV